MVSLTICERMAKSDRNVAQKGIWRCSQNLWIIFSIILD